MGKLAGYWLAQASTASFVVILSLMSSNISGYTKETTVNALA